MNDHTQWLVNNDKYLAAMLVWLRLRLEKMSQAVANTQINSSDMCNTGGWFKRSKQKSSEKQNKQVDDEAIELARQEMIKLEKQATNLRRDKIRNW